MTRFRFGAREACWLVILIAWLMVLKTNWPGHLSVDSILALREGRFHVRETWNPALFPWMLGVFDGLQRGTGLYIAFVSLILFAGWAAMPALRSKVSWLGPVALALAVLTPQLAIYQGIVWKDVSFANSAVAGFVALALAVRARTDSGRRGWLLASAILLAMASLLRQNAMVMMGPAVVALIWARWPVGWRRAVLGAAGFTATWLAASLIMSIICQPQGVGPPDGIAGGGKRLVQIYDIVGVAARDPSTPLKAIRAANPAADAYLRAESPRVYSAVRVDSLNVDKGINDYLSSLHSRVIEAQWFEILRERPSLYLAHRADAFKWMFATPVIDKCLPVHIGVEGLPKAMESLKLQSRHDRRDGRLYNYATWFFDTPAMSHVAYAVAALAVMGLLLVRREPADIVMAGLMAGVLTLAASFFIITLACDYRYLYVLDLAALTGIIYLAMDPRLRRRK